MHKVLRTLANRLARELGPRGLSPWPKPPQSPARGGKARGGLDLASPHEVGEPHGGGKPSFPLTSSGHCFTRSYATGVQREARVGEQFWRRLDPKGNRWDVCMSVCLVGPNRLSSSHRGRPNTNQALQPQCGRSLGGRPTPSILLARGRSHCSLQLSNHKVSNHNLKSEFQI